jgi:hypothetical protein
MLAFTGSYCRKLFFNYNMAKTNFGAEEALQVLDWERVRKGCT